MAGINVLGFSECGLPNCDCGARVVLGLKRKEAKRLVELITAAGINIESVYSREDAKARLATDEPMYDGASANFLAYAERA